MKFREGPRNDEVKVFVDGTLEITGTSWEDYFRYCEGNPTRTVDSVLFRTAGVPAPATLGKGFLIDRSGAVLRHAVTSFRVAGLRGAGKPAPRSF